MIPLEEIGSNKKSSFQKQRLISADMTDREIIDSLWQLLDNIDTLSDICKPTLEDPKAAMAFYTNAMRYAEKRFELLSSDGYRTFTQRELDTPNGQSEFVSEPIWTVLSIASPPIVWQGNTRKDKHIIENESGCRRRVDLSNLADEHLAGKQPQLSDEDEGFNSQWEEYESYQRNYLIGKRVIEMSDGGNKYFILVDQQTED